MSSEIEVEIPFKFGKLKVRGSNLEEIVEKIKTIDFEKIEKEINTKKINTIKIEPKKERFFVNDFIREKKPDSYYDKILCCIYFLYKWNDIKTVNQIDLKNIFVEASLPMPRNLNDMMNKLKEKILVSESPELKEGLKAWYITQSGIEYVENIKGVK